MAGKRIVKMEQINWKDYVPYNFNSGSYYINTEGQVIKLRDDLKVEILPFVVGRDNGITYVDFGSHMQDVDVLIAKHFCPNEMGYHWIYVRDLDINDADNIQWIDEYFVEQNKFALGADHFREVRMKLTNTADTGRKAKTKNNM